MEDVVRVSHEDNQEGQIHTQFSNGIVDRQLEELIAAENTK